MNKTTSETRALNFLTGGGEMGERIRVFNWAATPLGGIESWPQSLKTSISLMLNSQHPMWLGWGPELTFFYNDAYIEVLSLAKHPAALGGRCEDIWKEIWDICGPLADKVFAKGESSFMKDVRLFMDRGGFLEEGFYSFSYSAIRDESGGVGGLFCTTAEETSKVLNTRRLRTLSELAAKTLLEKSTAGACASAIAILKKNPDDMPFVLIYLLNPETTVAILEQAAPAAGHAAISPPAIQLSEPGENQLWPMGEVAQQVEPKIISIRGIADFPLGPADQPLQQALLLPLISGGQKRPLGVLVTGINPTRMLDEEYQSFLDLVASHVATAITNARNSEQEKKRADALAELDRAKTTFFSNVSHELRTPLTLILGPLEDEIRAGAAPSPRLQLIHRNSLRLLKLVNTLLDFSRIEAGRVEASFEPTDLAVYTAELASVFRAGMEKAGLRFVVNCPPLSQPVYVDRDMWEKIVFNLLSNALKFTFEGEVEISLREASAAAHHQVDEPGQAQILRDPSATRCVRLTVRDTGTGITAAELPKVFERFHRVRNARSRSHEGTGIGLALVQELARLHGGRVEVESEEGRGTAFTVSIPTGASHLPRERIQAVRTLAPTTASSQAFAEETMRWLPDAGRASSEIPAAELLSHPATFNAHVPSLATAKAKARILLADDNSDMRDYVRQLLAAQGYEVSAVENGRLALEAARAQTPSLVLSDVMMPHLDGFGLLRELRNEQATRGIPIILLSARAGEEARVEGVEAGADDYLTKPFSARELLARVHTHLELARTRREAGETLDSITDGLHVVDAAGRITYLNAEARRIIAAHGMDVQGMIGQNFFEVFPETLKLEVGQAMKRTLAERVPTAAESFYAPWQEWFSVRHYPSADGGVSTFFQNITQRKIAENQLKEANTLLADKATHLESLVQQRTAKLSETIGELEAFSYSIAHDMRSPLRSLKGFSDILLSSYTDKLDEEGQTFLQRIAKSAGRMDKLIQDVLNYSRVVRVDLPLETVDTGELIRDILNTYPMFLPEKADIVLAGELPRVLGNEAVLTQIFSNLLGNAVKFVAEGVKPQVKVWAETRGEAARLLVRDNGIGIPADQYDKIFGIFQQANKNYEGTGIGLAIVKKGAERLGGRVGLVSEPGEGSTFWVELKLAKSAPAAE